MIYYQERYWLGLVAIATHLSRLNGFHSGVSAFRI